MDPVNQVNPALDVLRRQLAENIEKLRKSGKFTVRANAGAARPAAPDAGSLQAALALRLAGLERCTPQGRVAATRVLVEIALVSEFGEGMLADPGFGALLGEISATLREDADIREQLDRLLLDI
jgi:hypothetical protein